MTIKSTYASIVSIFLSFLCLSMPVYAQAGKCEGNPAFRALDFWVGEWDVFNSTDGAKLGTSSVQPIQKGCAVSERWRAQTGSTGESLNYYNPITDRWRQVWVSTDGYAIDIVGNINKDGQMVMVGEIHYYSTKIIRPFQGTWIKRDNGSVRQYFQEQDDSGNWQDWFNGIYVRQSQE